MTLLLRPDDLPARRAAVAGGLAPLARSLRADLDRLAATTIELPTRKARMTRSGGRCAADGMLLDFDPWSPHEHRCARCGAVYHGEAHDRWWIMGYQLWLAERAVHSAALHLLTGDAEAGRLAATILDRCAAAYLAYPNSDNVLGPSRPFFSTYLESIWLLQLCTALDMHEAAAGITPLGARVRDRLIEPSNALVASYDEGLSNRQVWNAAALAASSLLLGDRAHAEHVLAGRSGLVRHLEHGLLPDGSWYEGENYHQFAHRGLWYGVTMAAVEGIELPHELLQRFDEGFATLFLTALPDLTVPSRRDSPYAVSLRQWRFAELCELGLARGTDARLLGALAVLYGPGAESGDTGRARSTADAERNGPGTALARADLGWRSLLHAREHLPPLVARPARSVLLEAQGLAIIRRDAGRTWVGLDYGHSGGGHGHPDRLNLLLCDGETRWLDDVGTGSYVDPSLHWYRSTLSHNAPMVDGHSQRRVHGTLIAYDERGGAGWISARAAESAPGATLTRSVIVMPDYIVDRLSWEVGAGSFVDLPLHVDGELVGVQPWTVAIPDGGAGPVDGFSYLSTCERAMAAAATLRLDASRDGASAALWIAGSAPIECWRAVGPGAPGQSPARFHMFRMRAAHGALTTVWSLRGAVRDVSRADSGVSVALADGTRQDHTQSDAGWRVVLHAGGARSSIDLAGLRAAPPLAEQPPAGVEEPRGRARTRHVVPRVHALGTTGTMHVPLSFQLGAEHYRRSELAWEAAGSPRALVRVVAVEETLAVTVSVRKGDPWFAPARDANDLDNEHPDINSDGVQLYLAPHGAPASGWLMVPESRGPAVRVTRIAGYEGDVPLVVAWTLTPEGYDLSAEIPLSALRADGRHALGLVVNEIGGGRERRRGQLVLGGATGEFVYLRGDREAPDSFIHFVIEHG